MFQKRAIFQTACDVLNTHGASCAVDTLLELYYHGIFKWNLSTPLHGSGLVSVLNRYCRERETKHQLSCKKPVDTWSLSQTPKSNQTTVDTDTLESQVELNEPSSLSQLGESASPPQTVHLRNNLSESDPKNMKEPIACSTPKTVREKEREG